MNTTVHARTALAIECLAFACATLICIGAAEAQVVAPQQASSLVADAIALEHGEGVAKDVVKAMAIYCDAARLGDAQAQFNLGWIYANGRGIVRDDGIAAQLFQMAANSGHPQAANMLRLVGAPASKVLDCLRENPVADATATTILDEKDELLGFWENDLYDGSGLRGIWGFGTEFLANGEGYDIGLARPTDDAGNYKFKFF